MATDGINITKVERMILVKDTIDRLQRASLEDILSSFCAKTGLSQKTKNLRQYVRRDLESLCTDARYLSKDYFLPNADKIEPGNEKDHKNVRVEYYIIKDSTDIIGGGLLEEANGKIISPNRNIIEWKLNNLSESFENDCLAFSMHLSQSGYISLTIKKEELPFNLILGKTTNRNTPDLQELRASFGQRSTLLLINEAGLEESVKNSKFGHCLITFGQTTQSFHLSDLSSRNGTFYFNPDNNEQQLNGQSSDHLMNEILYMASKDIEEVVILKPEPLTLDRSWQKVSNNPVKIISPSLVRCGRFVFYISVI